MILVTGGTGFVGAHLLYRLTSMGVSVKALKRKNSSLQLVKKIFNYYSNDSKALFSKIEWENADLQQLDSLRILLQGVNKVYHCAGFVSYNPEDKVRIMQTNLVGTKNLLKAALEAGVDKFLYLSSIAATDKNFMRSTVTEEMVWRQETKNSNYARSKFLAELAVLENMVYGLKSIIINPSNILGPGSWNSGTSKLIQNIWKGLTFYPEGINGFVDVRDVAEVMILLMDSNISGERFIVNAENLAYKDVFKWIANALGIKTPGLRFNAIESELAWRGIKAFSRVAGKQPPIDKESLKILRCNYYYSNEKVKSATGIRFIPIFDSIRFTTNLFLKEKK